MAVADTLRQRGYLDEATRRRIRRRARLRQYGAGLAFIAPSFFFLIVVMFLPVVWVVVLSFESGGILTPTHWVGLANWRALFQDPVAVQAIKNTAIYVVLVTPASMVAALFLAVLLRHITKGRSVFRAFLYFPVLTPYVVAAIIWTFVINPDFGVLNVILGNLGFSTVDWLGPSLALVTIALLEFWHGLGYWTIIFLAGLSALPDEVYEAAKMDGASGPARFWWITLPLLRSTFIFAIVVALIFNFQVFDAIQVLTQGGPGNATQSMAVYIYQQTFEFNNPGLGAVMSVLLLAVTLVITMIVLRVLRGGRRGARQYG